MRFSLLPVSVVLACNAPGSASDKSGDTQGSSSTITIQTPTGSAETDADTDSDSDSDSDADVDSDTDTDADTDTAGTSTAETGLTAPTGDTGTPCVPQSWYYDGDGDGATGLEQVIESCDPQGAGWSNTPPTDCDDIDPLINPGMPEVVGDEVDNNCRDGVDECVLGQSRLRFVYHSEPGVTNVQLSTEMNNFGMHVIAEGSPFGWHLTTALDPLTNVTTLTASNDLCTLDTTLWQASASFDGIPGAPWECVDDGNPATPYLTYGWWEVYEDEVWTGTTHVNNGLNGCETQVN